MRLATITNWAYGATVILTAAAGTTMLLASDAQERERAAVEQRYRLDQATSKLGAEIYALTGHTRQFVITGDPIYLTLYAREAALLRSVERRIRSLRDAGARADELNALQEGIRWADTLHDEQRTAIAARQRGDGERARQIIFGAEYGRELDRAEGMIERFQYRLDQRTQTEVAHAEGLAALWRRASEAVLAVTGFLFLCVLYFVFKRRVLHPVIKLSDVIGRLAAQDFAAEPPAYDQIDEIGDMAQALRVFRENGIERQRLEHERDLDSRVRDLLSRMTQRMQGCETMEDLLTVVARFAPEIAPDLPGRLYLLDAARKVMVEATCWLGPVHSRAEFSPLACWALARGALHRPLGDVVDVPCAHLDANGGRAADTICIPLVAQRETLGLLYFDAQADRAAARTPEVYLRMMAENIGLAVANLRLRDALRDMAMTDPLTGLANRRRLDVLLAARLADAERTGDPIACIMLDVDHFKRFNDEFGHDAGDTVLREIGALLRHAGGAGFGASRYGGEEFALLLPGYDAERARGHAEAIRERVRALRVRHDGHELGPVTVSLGVASVPEHGVPGGLLRAADLALRAAKRAGRDRVVIAAPQHVVTRAVQVG
jgi:diguanylate cyclase (GGDEF)-like protein